MEGNHFENFEEARLTIIKDCNFKTSEERLYYFMFDKRRKIFLEKKDEINSYMPITKGKNYKKNHEQEDLIMVNVKLFSKQICDILNKETLSYSKKNKVKDINENTRENENEIRRIMRYLTKYLNNNYFTEEFINNNGISYLEKIIKYNTGNLRAYALENLSLLLDFEIPYKYFNLNIGFFSIIFYIANENNQDSSNIIKFALDLMIKIIFYDKTKIMFIIEVAEKYTKENNTNLFQGIVDNLEQNNVDIELRLKSLVFINSIINYCEDSKSIQI